MREMAITFAKPIRRRADVGVAPGSQSWPRLGRLAILRSARDGTRGPEISFGGAVGIWSILSGSNRHCFSCRWATRKSVLRGHRARYVSACRETDPIPAGAYAKLAYVTRFDTIIVADMALPIQNSSVRIKVMKYLLSGIAIVAALAIASPVSAQGYGPGPGARTGTGPGVTPPGGLGPSSPLSNLPGQGAPGYAPAQPPAAAPGMAPGDTTSAMPPAHRHARASAHHGMKAHPPEAMTGTTAAQLNQEELNRLQAGNFANPPAPGGMPPAR